MSTRERILREALELFSVSGYDAVSLRDIAAAVGIRESSLYNHFRNKRELFDSIVGEFLSRSDEYFRQAHLIGDDLRFSADERTVDLYGRMPAEQFVETAGRVFEAVFADEIGVKLRRMLTLQQYRSAESARLFREISFGKSLEFQTRLFGAMFDEGYFVKADPEILALEFFAPVFLIFYKFDGDPESAAQAKALFMRHVRHFGETHAAKRENPINRRAEGESP